MVEKLIDRVRSLEIERESLIASLVKVDAKIEVYNEVIEEMTAEATECVEEPEANTFDVVQ